MNKPTPWLNPVHLPTALVLHKEPEHGTQNGTKDSTCKACGFVQCGPKCMNSAALERARADMRMIADASHYLKTPTPHDVLMMVAKSLPQARRVEMVQGPYPGAVTISIYGYAASYEETRGIERSLPLALDIKWVWRT